MRVVVLMSLMYIVEVVCCRGYLGCQVKVAEGSSLGRAMAPVWTQIPHV